MMPNEPLISCVMPTRGRQEMVRWALHSFYSQTYENKELMILDDEQEPSFVRFGLNEDMRYSRLSERSIPKKRNIINALAQGEIICHFDSDDWSDPNRLRSQLHLLQESEKAVTGFHSILMLDEKEEKAFKFTSPAPLLRYALGTSLMYRRDYWLKHRFDETKPIASDVDFVEAAYRAGELTSADGGQLMVATIHDGNSSKKRRDNNHNYSAVDWFRLPEAFRQTLTTVDH